MQKELKNIILLSLIIITIISSSQLVKASDVSALSNQKFEVSIDGRKINFFGDIGSPMLLTTERTFVPIRVISEYMGYIVDYSKDTWSQGIQKVWINDANNKVEITINQAKALVNEKEIYIDYKDGVPVLDSKAFLYQDRTYVPLRFISEAFGADVGYKRVNGVHVITITTAGNPVVPPVVTGKLIEPKFVVQQNDTKDTGVFFEIHISNFKEYLGTDAKFSARLQNYPQYDYGWSRNPYASGEWIEIIAANDFQNRAPYGGEMFFKVYQFLQTKGMLDKPDGKPIPLPKIGEEMTVKVTLRMNGESKDYNIKVPFLGNKSSY